MLKNPFTAMTARGAPVPNAPSRTSLSCLYASSYKVLKETLHPTQGAAGEKGCKMTYTGGAKQPLQGDARVSGLLLLRKPQLTNQLPPGARHHQLTATALSQWGKPGQNSEHSATVTLNSLILTLQHRP